MTTVQTNDDIVRGALKRVTTVATLPTSALNIMKIAEDPASTECVLDPAQRGAAKVAALYDGAGTQLGAVHSDRVGATVANHRM